MSVAAVTSKNPQGLPGAVSREGPSTDTTKRGLEESRYLGTKYSDV